MPSSDIEDSDIEEVSMPKCKLKRRRVETSDAEDAEEVEDVEDVEEVDGDVEEDVEDVEVSTGYNQKS
jgi:hypothetical protein